MSPSRRRAIGAVRGLAVRPVSGALGVTGRRALRGYRGGAHGDAPSKTLSVCYRHYARGVPDAITHAHRPRRITPAYYPRALPCGAMGTSRPTAITPAITHRKIRTRGAHAIIHAHHPGGAMVGRRASRLAPYRHYARIFAPPRHRPPGLPAPWRRAPTAYDIGDDHLEIAAA